MFPRRYFAARYFAPRYWPQSQGGAPPAPAFVPASTVNLAVGVGL